MSSHAEIFTALADAMAAYNLRPELEKKIEELTLELSLYKDELSEAEAKIHKLECDLTDAHVTMNTLDAHLESANANIAELRNELAFNRDTLALTRAHSDTLEVELRGKDILIEALEADKAALFERVRTSEFDASQLKGKLTAFINSVSHTSAPAVAETLTFPVANEPEMVEQPVYVESVSEFKLDLVPEPTKPINPVNFLDEPAITENELRVINW